MRTRPRVNSRRARGLSLVEILVSIGVVAILVAITLPALSGARVSAGRTRMLSNLRGIGTVFEVYTQTYDGCYPFHSRTDWYRMSPPDEGPSILRTDDPWAMSINWPSVFHEIAPWREHYRSWLNDGRSVSESVPWFGDQVSGVSGTVSYIYTHSFMARPEVWRPGLAPLTAGEIDRHLAPVRAPEVTSPPLKALCFDADRAYLRRAATPQDPRGVLTADGSASLRSAGEGTEPVQNRVNDASPRRYHDTPNGVRGRDFQ